MEFKTTEDVKGILTQAAALVGVDVTAFVIGTAAERARAIIAENAVLQLSRDGQARFLEMLNNPPPATDALRELMALPALQLVEK
jgi:uncharacterized protein (DUF1778 family)